MLTYATRSPELGIDADFSEVNLLEGANFNPEFLKLVSGGCLLFVRPWLLTSRSVRIPMLPFPPLRTGESRTRAPRK
jgi:hypothetical protein